MQPIILASKSPRRKQLLEMAEINFEVITKDTDETYPTSLQIHEVPEFIALQKAKAISNEKNKDRIIIAADTIVTIAGTIIGKPKNRENAIEILEKLSSNTHQVISGVVLLYRDKAISFHEITSVTFHPLEKKQIEHYVDYYTPFDKAGAYAIQEWIGAVGIKSIEGDYYNVMGLPISRVVRAIKSLIN